MRRKWSPQWRLLGICFVIAAAWDYLFLWASLRLDPDHRLDRWLAEAPEWFHRVYAWTPQLLAHRILRLFGFRFDMQHYEDNGAFILAATCLTWLIWTALLYGSALVILRIRRSSNEVAAA